MFEKILVGMDGSDGARHALERALELATLTGGHVHVLSVEEHLPAYAATVSEVEEEVRFESHYFRRVQSEARRVAHQRGLTITTDVVPGHAAETIIRTAREGGHDLIVLGHAGHARIMSLLLGSTADRVTEHAPCPVLIVR